MHVRYRIVVSGRVQGVGFRYATMREAQRLRLRGWVRNTPDGKVEMVAEGIPDDVRQLVAWCHAGPPSARVTRVFETPIATDDPLDTFHVTL